MEKVQFQLEATLPELKDLYEKGLFAKNEIDQITKRRTAFETSLIRRQTRKEDFFKYAEYEINLEKLRKVRWKRLKYHLNPPPPSASTYSLPRRAAYILKRATVKFPGDLAVWLAYVEYASREGMRKVVLKGLNSALHHHPLSSTLYLLLSYHHLHPNSPFPGSSIPSTSKLDLPSVSADDQLDGDDAEVAGFSLEGTASARTNILLGLRMIPKSHDLWREYIKLELGWVEGLRRRWKVLGVNIEAQPAPGSEVDPNALTGGEGSFGPDGEDARKSILSGQLIIHAINSALAAIPSSEGEGMEFRESLVRLLRVYPSALRTKCLDVVYSDLGGIAESGGDQATRAKFAVLTKELYDRPYAPGTKDEGGVILEGAELVDAVGRIGKEIRSVAKSGRGGSAWLDMAGEWLVQQMALCGDNSDLRQYLFSIMTALTKSTYKPSASFLTLHIEQLEATRPDPTTLLTTVRAHAAQHPTNPSLQRMRLVLEVSDSTSTEPESIRRAFKEATKACLHPEMSHGEQQDVLAIWIAYLDWEETQSATDTLRLDGIYKRLLRETLRQTAVPELHPSILAKYFEYSIRQTPSSLLSTLERITSTYRPSYTFFREAFDVVALRSDEAFKDLKSVYRQWRAASQLNHDKVGATLYWVEWLLDHHHGKEASDAVDVMRREVSQDKAALADLDAGWTGLMDAAEQRSDEDEEDSEGDIEMTRDVGESDGDDSDEESGSEKDGNDVDMVV